MRIYNDEDRPIQIAAHGSKDIEIEGFEDTDDPTDIVMLADGAAFGIVLSRDEFKRAIDHYMDRVK